MKRLIVSFLFIINLGFSQTNYSLSFDGADDYVDCGNDTSLYVTEDFTIELWFKQTEWSSDPSNYNYLFSKRDGASTDAGIVLGTSSDTQDLWFWITRSEENDWGYVSGNFTANHTIQLNQWYHVVVVFSGSEIESYETNENITIYLNGLVQNIEIASNFTGSIPDHSNAPLTIGNRSDLNRPFLGSIDEVRVWDTVRSETEIRENILNDLSGAEYGLVGYWNFNEGTGATAEDVSPNTNDGVITGAVFSTDLHPNLLALFSSDRYIQLPPFDVQFTDYSLSQDSIVSWNWDFGDGTASLEQNPIHSYTYDSTYTVSLTVTDIHDSTDTFVKENLIMVNSLATITSPISGDSLNAYNNYYYNIQWTSKINTNLGWRLDLYKGDTILLSSYYYQPMGQEYHEIHPNYSYQFQVEDNTCGSCLTDSDYKFRLNGFIDDWNPDGNYVLNDSGWVESDYFTILNPMPTPAEVIYPTLQDTFSTHVDNDVPISFTWYPSEDIDSDDVIYTLTIELEFFGNTYTDEHENISDTTYDVSSHSLDVLLGGLNLDESTLLWYVKSSDGEYNVMSDSGQFVLTRSVLGLNNQFSIPTEFSLHQNYPNPFNPVTTLRYDLPENGMVNITIYNMLGKQVKTLINQTQDAGYRSVIWDATNDYGKPVSAGIYLYQIQAGEYMQTKKMVLLK
jgi:PKD repeat protein